MSRFEHTFFVVCEGGYALMGGDRGNEGQPLRKRCPQ